MIEVLWAPDANLGPVVGLPTAQLQLVDPMGELLRKNRSLFLSQKVLTSYGGYASGQLRNAQAGTGGSRGVNHLKREKFIRHLFRLFEQGTELLETGDMDIQVKDPEGLREKSKWSLDRVEVEFNRLDKKMAQAARRSPLPQTPDMEKINGLLLRLRLDELKNDHSS